jgi:hypothetical protein
MIRQSSDSNSVEIRWTLVLLETELYGIVTSSSVTARLKENIDTLSNENNKQGLKGNLWTALRSDDRWKEPR